eukprot:CAMPEP_0172680454 /NCGR_PEP_ID=MMETSP1074-20121228/16775_1 /TAXON_ID=2916 /ORGANISM="Ceratium fusus, Strain PA161109" /LENGTH=899 /DNA_ID=CAMNT_0013498785 /DNA_START=99 /DNA_END=2798 /DNA_ORIENTATION=-
MTAVYPSGGGSSLNLAPPAPNCNSPPHLTSPHHFQARVVPLSAKSPQLVISGGSLSPHAAPYKMAKVIGVGSAQEQLQSTEQAPNLMYQTHERDSSQLPLLEELGGITKSLDIINKASRRSERATSELQSTVLELRQELDEVRRMQLPLAEHLSGEMESSAWSGEQAFPKVAGMQSDVGRLLIQQQQQAIQLCELEQRVAEHLRGLKEQQQSEALMLRQELEHALGAGGSADNILDLLSRMVEATMNGLPAAPADTCNYEAALDAERRERNRELGELAAFMNTSLAEVRAEVSCKLPSTPAPEIGEEPQHLESLVKALLRPERDARADLAMSLEAERVGRVQDLQNERDARVREMSDLRTTIQHLTEQLSDQRNSVAHSVEELAREHEVNRANYEASLLGLQSQHENYDASLLGLQRQHENYDATLLGLQRQHENYEASLLGLQRQHESYEASRLGLQRQHDEVSTAVSAIYDGQVGVPRDYLEAMETERQARGRELAELTAFVQEIREEIFTTVNAAFDETRVETQMLARQFEEGPKPEPADLESIVARMMPPLLEKDKEDYLGELEAERRTRMQQIADVHAATDQMSERVSACQESISILGEAERGLAQQQTGIEIRLADLAACVELIDSRAKHSTVDRQARLKEGAPLRVTVLGARGLHDADWLPGARKSDTYCICELEGKPHATKIETQAINSTCDPYWDFEGGLTNYVAGDSLVFKVYDQDWAKNDELLGVALLSGENFHRYGFEGDLPLQDAGEGISATLQLRVAPATEAAPTSEQIDQHDLDIAKLAGLVSEEAGRWRETSRMHEAALVEASSSVEQLWYGVEAIGVENRAHTADLQMLLNFKEDFHEVQAAFMRVADQQAALAHNLSKLMELRDQVDVMWSERRAAPALLH